MIIEDLSDLEVFAKSFSKKLKIYDTVILDGDLGAGKTQLVKFICKY